MSFRVSTAVKLVESVTEASYRDPDSQCNRYQCIHVNPVVSDVGNLAVITSP